ncbi:MAG: pyrimidine 5'-nucleotidase [Chloroflexi bacterium]|nr:pyrimidine 5'-nucleotidase [Chloroflexota bacterium]
MIFFDLDDTVYPPNSGIWQAIGARMDRFLIDRLSIPMDSVAGLREKLFKEHGTTLRGLVTEYQINDQEFLDFVHDIPIHKFLSTNLLLKRTLELYPQRKIIFTNADTNHANRVLKVLGIFDVFEQIIDIRSVRPYCKPMPEAFDLAFSLSGIKSTHHSVMIDDAHRNLVTANNKGMFTIQVGTNIRNPYVDAAIENLTDLPNVIPLSKTKEVR